MYHFKMFSCSPHTVDVLVQMKYEHVHAIYWTPWKILYDPEFCAYEQQQQWYYNRRSRKGTACQHIRHLWRCATFFATLIQCNYQQFSIHTNVQIGIEECGHLLTSGRVTACCKYGVRIFAGLNLIRVGFGDCCKHEREVDCKTGIGWHTAKGSCKYGLRMCV
jgi:hypothetical protein